MTPPRLPITGTFAIALTIALAGCDDARETGAAPSATAPETTADSTTTSTSSASAPEPEVLYDPETLPEAELREEDLEGQRAAMLRRMRALEVIDEQQAAALGALLAGSKRIGQGNPDIVAHPMTRPECLARRKQAGVKEQRHAACGGPFMAPVYDPAREQADDARVCIDRYEFPGLPCEYPVTWVTTNEAHAICGAIGKRLCDAHEWEGACAGALLAADKEYRFGHARSYMRALHNQDREIRWAYGPEKDHARCGTQSKKSKGCQASGWRKCASNSYPAGAFPECRSPLGVYDQHGNVAEHMWLPLREDQLGTSGGTGVPEMKGSWFIFHDFEAHKDDCRWRAPAWHDNEGKNHSNYHLGFRCCKDAAAKPR